MSKFIETHVIGDEETRENITSQLLEQGWHTITLERYHMNGNSCFVALAIDEGEEHTRTFLITCFAKMVEIIQPLYRANYSQKAGEA